MEENSRQRVSAPSEISMDIDETTAVSGTTKVLVDTFGDINPEIKVPAISILMADQNHHLTDNILLHEKANFCEASHEKLPGSLKSDYIPYSLEDINVAFHTAANCAILNESKTEAGILAPGTAATKSGADEVFEQEMTNIVPIKSPVNGNTLLDPFTTSNLKEDILNCSKNERLETNFISSPNESSAMCVTEDKQEKCIVPQDVLSESVDGVQFQSHQEPLEAVSDFSNPIRLVASAWTDFQNGDREGFTKGCKWSPDGLCLLTNSEDNSLRIFELPRDLQRWRLPKQTKELPEMRAVLRMPEGGLIYDYCWYPLMSSFDPSSCCLVSSAQDNPVHLWDAYDGSLRATYRGYNQVDEIESATSLAFNPSGDKIYCGFKNRIRVFDTAVPGRDCDTIELRDRKVADSQKGIVSCIAIDSADPRTYAVGTYLKSIGIYSANQRQAVAYLLGHVGGLTQLTFSADGTRLYSGGRRDNDIICWDLRNSAQVLYTMQREVLTNQRIQFDLTSDSGYLVSGGTDGLVSVWDLAASPLDDVGGGDPVLPALKRFRAHADCVNGVSVHDKFPVLATSSGQRHFPAADFSSSESLNSNVEESALKRSTQKREDCVKLWWTGAYE